MRIRGMVYTYAVSKMMSRKTRLPVRGQRLRTGILVFLYLIELTA